MHGPDEKPFLDAIFAQFHDDVPRLIYADFLDESGHEARAELIRLQITLQHLPEDHPRRPELAERQAELLTTHAQEWTDSLSNLVTGVEFRRGIPDSVSMEAGLFLEEGSRVFELLRVRRLRLLDCAQVIAKVLNSSLLREVEELDLCGNELGDEAVSHISRTAKLSRVRSLDLGFNRLTDRGVSELARTSTLASLTELSLNDNREITHEGVAALSASPGLGGLTRLDLSGNNINEIGVRAVVAGTWEPCLHTLRLKGNPIGDAGLGILLTSPLLPRLLARSPLLDFRDNGLGPNSALGLAASPHLARCRTLDLTENDIGDRGFAALAASSNLGCLRSLRLGRNQISDVGVRAARHRLPILLAGLRSLDLSGNRLTRHGLGLLQTARGESKVQIDLAENVQTPEAGNAPVRVGDVMPGILEGVAEAAALRHRISHPRALPAERQQERRSSG
jgi:uncharacterized protein (TIGR02996 family)